jgi:Tol biopolymer transport system component
VNPSDGRIAFTLFRRQALPNGNIEETHHIAWVNAEGGAPQFYSISGAEHTPQWSPDGAWLAYVAYDGRIPGPDIFSTAPPTPSANATPVPEDELLNEADLWAVSADGLTKYRLTAFPVGNVSAPRWSPDALLLSFIYSATPSNDQYWIIANADAAIPTQLSYEWTLTLDHTWLPDSTALLATMRDFQGISENRLWRVPLVGNADVDATQYGIDPNVRYLDYPRFSSDGRYLAFRSEYSIALLDVQSNSLRWLDEGLLGGNAPPVWSPAGFTSEAACPTN